MPDSCDLMCFGVGAQLQLVFGCEVGHGRNVGIQLRLIYHDGGSMRYLVQHIFALVYRFYSLVGSSVSASSRSRRMRSRARATAARWSSSEERLMPEPSEMWSGFSRPANCSRATTTSVAAKPIPKAISPIS